jgi:hypothetical protein
VIPTSSTFTAGENFVIYNSSGSASITISVQNTGTQTLRFAGSDLTGTRTLARYGVATILCVGTNTFVITGAGLV